LRRKKYNNEKNPIFVFVENTPESIIPSSENFTDFNHLETARQICLYEQELLRSTNITEYLNQYWLKEPEKAPNIIKLRSFQSDLSKWVSSLIINERKIDKRVLILKKSYLNFIRII